MPPLGLSCLGLCTSWTWLAVSFSMLNKLLTHQLWDQGNEINYQVLFLFPFWGPYNAMLVCLILFQRPARLSPFLFILSVYSLLWQWCPSFCPPGHLSILQPQLFCYWFLCIFHFRYCAVFFIFVCLFILYSLVKISCIFSIFASIASILFLRSWIIFTILILNSFSGRLPISTSFSSLSWSVLLFLHLEHNPLPCHFG